MPELSKVFYILALVFLLMGLIFNLYPNLPRLPGDIYIDRPNMKIYIPITSALIISVVLTFLFNSFRQ